MLFPPAIPEGAEYHTSTTVKSIESLALLSPKPLSVVCQYAVSGIRALRSGQRGSHPNTP